MFLLQVFLCGVFWDWDIKRLIYETFILHIYYTVFFKLLAQSKFLRMAQLQFPSGNMLHITSSWSQRVFVWSTCNLRWNVTHLMSLFKFGTFYGRPRGCWLNFGIHCSKYNRCSKRIYVIFLDVCLDCKSQKTFLAPNI